MNNVSITISTTDNITQAFGYNPTFYKDVNARNIDITNDMTSAKERFGDKVAIVGVAEWEEDVKTSNGIIYKSIDEVLKAYKPAKTKTESEK